MTLHVAVMGGPGEAPGGRSASWGSWAVHDVNDAAGLATDPAVTAAETVQVLVLAPEEALPAARIAAAAIAATRPDISVRVEGHPVSLGVLVRALESVTNGPTTANALHASFTAALGAATWGASLPSVAKLTRPAPSVWQHVQSWTSRGDGFIAVHGTPGWVARLPAGDIDPSRLLPRVQDASTGGGALAYECHSFGELPESAIAALFRMGLATRPTRRPALGDAEAVWGHEKAVEFVIAPSTPPSPGTPSGICGICDQPVWGQACPFCRSVVQSSQPRAATPQGVVN